VDKVVVWKIIVTLLSVSFCFFVFLGLGVTEGGPHQFGTFTNAFIGVFPIEALLTSKRK
jgi:hypothetical protein